jgi:hypothetical protein
MSINFQQITGAVCASLLAAAVIIRSSRNNNSPSQESNKAITTSTGGAFGETVGDSSVKVKVVIVSCDELVAAGSGASGSFAEAGADECVLYDTFRSRGIPFHVRSWSDTTVKWSSYDIVLVRTCWDYSVSEARAWAFTRFLSNVAESGVLIINDARVQTWNIHKGYLAEMAAVAPKVLSPRLDFSCIPSVLVAAGTRGDLRDIVTREGWLNCGIMIKPAVGGGSRACLAVHNIHNILGTTGTKSKAFDDAQAFLDTHTLGAARETMTTKMYAERIAMAALVAAPHQSLAPSPLHIKLSPSVIEAAGADANAMGARDARDVRASAWEALATRAAAATNSATNNAPDSTTAAAIVPCDMFVQPFLPSVSEGELSVIVIDGRVSHAVQKIPLQGSWRCQEEFGAVATVVPISPLVEELVLRIVQTARSAAETAVPCLTTPSSPGAAESFSQQSSCALPQRAILVARVDLLRLTPEMATILFATGGDATTTTASSHHHRPDLSRTPYLLLEAEMIEPALFFKEAAKAGIDAAGNLVNAIVRELASRTQKHG